MEAAVLPLGTHVRDSKAPHDGLLTVSAPAWQAFLSAVSDGAIHTHRH